MALDPLSQTLFALADPTRRAIVQRLSKGDATVNELADPFEMSVPAISKHLKVLERAGLVEQGRDRQFRPRTLRPEPLKELSGWLDGYRRFWEESLDRLDDYLQHLQRQQSEGAMNERDRNEP